MYSLKEMELNSDVRMILNSLRFYGYETYIIGGAVRNHFLSLEINDYDFATSATTDEIMDVFKEYKPLNRGGLKHGTVSILVNGVVYEITTFKGGDFRRDLSLRDFTINSIAFDGENFVYPEGAIDDLINKTLRTLNPSIVINKNPLRILRGLRFVSTLGFKPDPETEKAFYAYKDRLDFVSAERLRDEFNKIIMGENFYEVLDKYRDIIAVVIPEIKRCFDFPQRNKYHNHDVYIHELEVLKHVKGGLYVRLAAFFHDIGKPDTRTTEIKNGEVIDHFRKHAYRSYVITERILNRLAYSGKEQDIILFLIKYHDVTLREDKRVIKRLLRLMGDDEERLFPMLVDLRRADRMDHNTYGYVPDLDEIERLYEEIKRDNEAFKLKDLKLNGNDLKDMGLTPGPIYKIVLNGLIDDVIDGTVENEKDALRKRVLESLKL